MEATDRWLTGIAAHLGWADRHKAYVALRVTLHALRDQVMLDECAQLERAAAADHPWHVLGRLESPARHLADATPQ